MDVLQLTATQFIQPMSTGRNRPLLLGCEDASGAGRIEVVVKFRGREMDEKAQSAELVSAQLADDLGLQAPQAAVVDVPVGFEARSGAVKATFATASPNISERLANSGRVW
jgi:hypothetical protein